MGVMSLIIVWFLNAHELVMLRYAKCDLITRPVGPDTVAVKWVCRD